MSTWQRHRATGVQSDGCVSGCLRGDACCCCSDWDATVRPSSPVFNRSARFVTIGSIRYGVRVRAVSPPPPGARYRASVGLLHQHRYEHEHDHDKPDEECCCGVVNLPWSRSVASVSRIPLLVDKQQPPINRCGIFSPVNSVDMPNGSASCTSSALTEPECEREHEFAVCRTRPTWSHTPRVGIGGCLTASDKVQVPSSAQLFLQNQLRRRVIVRSQSDAATAYVKLYEAGACDTGAQDFTSSLDEYRGQARRINLDRLNRFRFGGNRANSKERDRDASTSAVTTRGKKSTGGRSDDKAERLRELTDRWKNASSQKYQCADVGRTFSPVPPPRNRHGSAASQHQQQQQHVHPYGQQQVHQRQHHQSQQQQEQQQQQHQHQTTKPAASVTSTKSQSPPSPPPPPPLPSVADAFACVNLQLPKPEARTVVGSYIQRTIPFRSASFSQVDYSTSDGKYFRRRKTDNIDSVSDTLFSETISGAALTLPRKRDSQVKVTNSAKQCSPSKPPSEHKREYSGSEITNCPYPRTSGVYRNASDNMPVPTDVADTDQEVNRLFQIIGMDASTLNASDVHKNDMSSAAPSPQTHAGAKHEDIRYTMDANGRGTVDAAVTSATTLDNVYIPGSMNNVTTGNKSVPECLTEGAADSERESGIISSEERKRDRSRRRKGMYISQWPDQRTSVMLACAQEELASEATVNPIGSGVGGGVDTGGDVLLSGLDPNGSEGSTNVSDISPKYLMVNVTSAGDDQVFNRMDWSSRPALTAQSSEEKDVASTITNPAGCVSSDVGNAKIQSSKANYQYNRTDSLSEGEGDQSERRPLTPSRDHLASPMLSPSDVSDNESRASLCGNDSLSPHAPRRYSKRPLRGPYGQMLEAEMKKPETSRVFSKHQYNNDLKFLDDFANMNTTSNISQRSSSPNMMASSMVSLTSSNSVGSGDLKPKYITRTRDSSNHSLDETSLKNSLNTTHGSNQSTVVSSPGRKVSVDVSSSAPNSILNDSDSAHNRLFICHQRTTSSPSKLEVISAHSQNERDRSASTEPSPELLRELLRGSSEQLTVASTSEANPRSGTGSLMHDDTRTHIVVELYETERSYVESLQILVVKYLEPLKSPENSGLLDAALVDEIFYQVPALLTHHQVFLEELRKRLEHWDVRQKIGDVFLDFTKPAVVETYTAFINNWKRAKEVIKTTSQAKPAFARFLEAMAREHKGKLALDSLLIKPVQKFPKYELLIQRLIKHTDSSHPDYQLLLDAQREIHENLIKINCTERETLEFEQQQQNLKDLESLVEGLINLVSADRTYLRHDLVTMSAGQGTRKERGLFLFSDLLVVTSIKRRSGTIRKPSGNCPGSVTSTLDANKYKLLMRIPLEDLEIMKTKDENVRRMMLEIENLNEDISLLNQISEMTWQLHCPHTQLEEVIREMLSSLNRQLSEQQNSDSQLSYLELTLNTPNGIENVSVVFSQPEKRASWEETFNEAKHKLAMSADRRPSPEFLVPVPIRKTRAGLQFTCAAPTLTCSANASRDVWVCNSDGYVGQVCVLSIYPEPTVTSCNGVCNARILCVASIPAGISTSTSSSNLRSSSRKTSNTLIEDDDRRSTNIQFDSSSSSDDEEDSEREDFASNLTKKGTTADRNKLAETASTDSSDDTDNLQPTMWLGTEDGCIHVYNCNDNIRIKKNKIRLQHGSSIQCIIYLDNRVFVSLANGDITIYSRDQAGGWNISSPLTVSVGTAMMPVNKMLPNNGKLWCGCSITIKIFNIQSLTVEHTFQANGDQNKPISCMVMSGLGVWISLQNSAVIKCFHSLTYDLLCEVNVAPSVTKMLTSCDDIIRQHKAACLRVTSLLACKDLLWIGTSAGVLLTMPLPHITSSTTKISIISSITGVPHGHTGHVRFLTCIESASAGVEGLPDNSNNGNKLLVISGGDGYEDFRSSNVSEVAGREDSTNHLLLWHV